MKKSVFRETHEQLKAEVEEMLEIVPEPKVEVVEEEPRPEKEKKVRKNGKRFSI